MRTRWFAEALSYRTRMRAQTTVLLALVCVACAPATNDDADSSPVVSVTVQVSSPAVESSDLAVVAERFNYAAAMVRLFLRERSGLRAEVGTLFVPLDSALATALASQQRTLDDLNSPSRYNLLLLRAHASSARLTFVDLSSSLNQELRLFSGSEVTIVSDSVSGALFLERADGSRVKIVANDVFVGDLVVHFIDQPIALPFSS